MPLLHPAGRCGRGCYHRKRYWGCVAGRPGPGKVAAEACEQHSLDQLNDIARTLWAERSEKLVSPDGKT